MQGLFFPSLGLSLPLRVMRGLGQTVAKRLFIWDMLKKSTIKKRKQHDKAPSVIIFQVFCVFLI